LPKFSERAALSLYRKFNPLRSGCESRVEEGSKMYLYAWCATGLLICRYLGQVLSKPQPTYVASSR